MSSVITFVMLLNVEDELVLIIKLLAEHTGHRKNIKSIKKNLAEPYLITSITIQMRIVAVRSFL